MKYTKLFNNHEEYVAYTASTSFIRPNVSYCREDDESHCTPDVTCQEGHEYEVTSTSYPETVPATALTFNLVINYSDTYTTRICYEEVTLTSTTVAITIGGNPTTSARTISGTYDFHGISIPYSLTQEGQEISPYEQQYLTFEILTGGTINWVAASGVTKTISYIINNGEWTEITSSASGTPINVSSGDEVRFKGTNAQYAAGKDACSLFSGGTAYYNAKGNVMSLIGGDNFVNTKSFNGAEWALHKLFGYAKIVSAENLVFPVMELTRCCYRALFANCSSLTTAPTVFPATTLAVSAYVYTFDNCVALTTAPQLPATTLADHCYNNMFHNCTSLAIAPDLLAAYLPTSAYYQMFRECANLSYIKCLATSISSTNCTASWVSGVTTQNGTFVKHPNMSGWTTGIRGIPSGWVVQNEGTPNIPTISSNGFEIELSCSTENADIYYQLDHSGSYTQYTTAITMTGDTFIECYAEKDSLSSTTTSQTCEFDDRTIYEYSNQSLDTWTRSGNTVTVPYSVNAIDGHSSNYARGTFDFETSVNLRQAEPTYLWFQHADQSAEIYVDNTLVEKHWGGYTAFFTDISNYVHKGTNHIKVRLKNNEGNNLAPASGDFNFNATLGNVKLFTSPYIPRMKYGYDGFHITSTVSTASATINVATTIPTGATVVCTISGVNCNYTATSASTNNEMVFTTTISNPRLWNGRIDPYLYNVKLEIYHDNELYHRYERPYGLRFYEYLINDTVKYGTAQNPYTGFLLNGQPYLLRGVCMHDDIEGKANALSGLDYNNTFATIYELGCNFIRLAHYPHPKETYDGCDQMGIIVQTEGPCVNKLESTMPEAYWTHLEGQYDDMVNQHYNHPCIMFWGLSNEAKVDNKTFAKTKIEGYVSQIKALDSERMVGLVGHALTNPSDYFGDPSNIDWIGSNLYQGWYQNQGSNNPTSQINSCISNTITRVGKAYALSEYGCGGTQRCHSESASTTTNKGSGGARHDIEYMMWLHEGHIAAIKNKPELLFSSQWQLFDIAVAARNEGYTVCLDGENTSIDEELRRLNDKGLVERDHVTKKDPFYLYKAWWNPTPFVHICQKNYTKTNDRVIKCYTNQTTEFALKVNGTTVETKAATDNILTFTMYTFSSGDVVTVESGNVSDTFTFE